MKSADLNELRSHVKEIEELVRFPVVDGHLVRMDRLALSVARARSPSPIPHLAMLVTAAISDLRRTPDESARARLEEAVKKLLDAIDAAKTNF
jgi:hypothetical protein